MSKAKPQKKQTLKIGVIAVIVLLLGASASASILPDLKNNEKVKDIYSFMGDIDNNYDLENIEESDLYNNFKELAGDGSKIHFCGPAKVTSIGKGLHLARNFKLVVLEIPLSLLSPDFLSFPRRLAIQWFIFCDYFNDENASTIIEPLGKNETILLNGSHTVLAGVYLFNTPMRLRNTINSILGALFNKTIDFPLKKLQGSMFWYWNMSRPLLFQYAVFLPMIMSWFLLWPFKTKSQFIGFVKQLEWGGYAPFVIWTDSSIIKPSST